VKAMRALVLPILASLLFLGGCGDQLPSDIDDPYGVEGYIEMGWDEYAAGNYDDALANFQAAIEADVTHPGGYLGAGWASINLADYWVIADNYFFMALQQSAGYAPLVMHTESQTQDTMWTVFECVDPDLPPDVLNPILEQLADSGAVWVGNEIYAIVNADSDPNIPYRFHAEAGGCASMFTAFNNFSLYDAVVDSIVPDGEGDYWVYILSDYTNVEQGADNVRTWINAGNVMTYDYFTFTPGALTQDSYDALAGWGVFQQARGENGDPLLGCAAGWALDRAVETYDFGTGTGHDDVVSLSMVNLKGNAAAEAFSAEAFRFSWFTCTSEGYGLGLLPTRDDFIYSLMQVIETMLGA
jgi:hypothetical protein